MALICVLFCFFSFYFWERDLEHHRHLTSVFGISISHSSASYPPSHVTYSLVFNQAAWSYDPRCFCPPSSASPPTGPSHARNKLSPRHPAHPALQLFLRQSPDAQRVAPTGAPSASTPIPFLSPSLPHSTFPSASFPSDSFFPASARLSPQSSFPNTKTQPVPHIQPTHSCASRAPPSCPYKRPPFASGQPGGGLEYPALSCNALRSGYFACRGAGLDCLCAASRGTHAAGRDAGDMRRASERPIRDRCVARCECCAGRCAAGEEGGWKLAARVRGRWEFFFWSTVERW